MKTPDRLYRVLVDVDGWENAAPGRYVGYGAHAKYLDYDRETGRKPRPFYTVSKTQVAMIRAKYGEFTTVSYIKLGEAEWVPA
ncbi:hypothetical protein GCM10010203_48350 [Actinomadura yumaensis]